MLVDDARIAAEKGRDLLALSSSIYSPMAKGWRQPILQDDGAVLPTRLNLTWDGLRYLPLWQ